MGTTLDADSAALSYAIEYQAFAGPANLDLRGKGRLSIHPEGPSYRFFGDRRTVFGEATALELLPAEISNVTIEGRKIEFATPAGLSGKKRKPFVFYCASPGAAAEIAGLLPRTLDPDFVSSQHFGRQLHMLPAASSPWTSVTNVIVAVNVLAFVVMGLLGAGWIAPADMTPYVHYVANNGGATTDGEWWRIVTSMFVHYGVFHLLFNMWALFQTGHFVERLFGRALFTLGYLGSGIIASFTSLFWHRDEIWSAGASGAVFGVYGLLLGFMLREKQSVPKPVLRPLFKSTLMFAGYNLLFGLVHPRIDNAAHLGGLLAGVALGWLVALPVDAGIRRKFSAARLQLGIAVLLVVTALAVTLAPRFDYRFREELAWAEVMSGPLEREPALLRQQNDRMAKYQPGQPDPALSTWLTSELIPFYEQWQREVGALEVTAGTRTAQRRRSLVTRLEAKLIHNRRLAEDVLAKDPRAAQRFHDADQQASAAAQVPATEKGTR